MQPLSKRSDGTLKGSNFRADGSDHQAIISSSTTKKPDEEDSGSEKYIIQKTTDWDVQYSDQDLAARQEPAADADEITPPDVVRGHTVL